MRPFLLAASACLLLAASTVQAQDKEALAIIDKGLEAQGGAEKAKTLKSQYFKAKGTIDLMGMNLDYTMEAYVQSPGKEKATIDLAVAGMQIKVTQVYNDGKGWTSVNGEVKESDKEEIEEHIAMEHVEGVISLYPIKEDKAIKLSPLGESKVGDVAVVGIQVTKKDKRDVNLYFDKKTNLLLKAEYRAMEPFTKQEVAQVKLFSDYKEMVPGYKMAAKQVISNDGKRFLDVEMTEVRVVDRHDDSVFAKPQ